MVQIIHSHDTQSLSPDQELQYQRMQFINDSYQKRGDI